MQTVRRYNTTRPWESTQLLGSGWHENEMMLLYPGVSRIFTPHCTLHLNCPSIPLHPASLIDDVTGVRDGASSGIHFQPEIWWTESGAWRPRSSEIRDALGGRDRVSLEMRWEAVIVRVWRCSGRPWSGGFGDALWGRDRARLEIQLETEIGWTQRLETGWERETVDLGMMLYLINAVLGVRSWSRHGEIERDDLTLCS